MGVKFSLSDDLVLDYADYAAEGMRVSIFARSGGGKSNLAALFIEQALEQGVQVCVVEPIEEWWTLKTEFDSVVWVGEGGDIPLHPGSASLYAKMLEDGCNLVVTVSTGDEFKDKDFAASLLWGLYTRWKKIRRPMLLVLEEADVYAPQMWASTDRLCLSRVITLAKRGRKLGINPIFLSQRPADIHKSVISQSNITFIGGFTTPQDLEAVRQLSKLIHLPIPTEGISRLSPGEFYTVFRGHIRRIKARLRHTPHGGVTPEITRPISSEFTQSVEEIRRAIEAEIKRMRLEEDELSRLRRENEELKKRISDLERQLEVAKVVKEIPVEIIATGPVSMPATTVGSTQEQIRHVPGPVLNSPYPQALNIWKCLVNSQGPMTPREIMAATGLGEETVRRILRYLRNKGLLTVQVARMPGGRKAIRSVYPRMRP